MTAQVAGPARKTATLGQRRMLEERLEALRRAWAVKADDFAAHHCDEAAAAYRLVAEEVGNELRAWSRELLTVEEAAEETGYSSEHLRRLVRHGNLQAEHEAGARTHWRLERGHLPAKTRQPQGGASHTRSTYKPDEDARDIAKQLGGPNA